MVAPRRIGAGAAAGALAVLVGFPQAGCQWIGGISSFALSADAGADAPPWCASLSPPPTVCSDFDETTMLSPPWTIPAAAGGATMSIDPGVGYSPASSLLVQVPSLVSGASAYAGLNYPLAASFSQARIEFEYRSDADTDDKIVELAWPSSYAIAIVLPAAVPLQTIPLQEAVPNADGSISYLTPSPSSSPTSAPNPTSGWIKIGLTFNAAQEGGAASAEVQIGDAAWTAPLSGPAPAAGAPLLRIGGVFIDDSPNGWSAHFDNVALYVQ